MFYKIILTGSLVFKNGEMASFWRFSVLHSLKSHGYLPAAVITCVDVFGMKSSMTSASLFKNSQIYENTTAQHFV